MKYKTQKEFLFGEGYLDGSWSSEEIKEAKKAWKKMQSKQYQKHYKKKHHRKELLFTNEEWNILTEALEHHNQESKNMSRFLKDCIFAYLNKGFVLPDDEAVQSVELEVRRIGVLINQLVRYIHIHQDIVGQDLVQLQNLYLRLEDFVYDTLRVPKSIEELLDDFVGDNPQLLNHIQTLLDLKRKQYDS